MRSPSPLAAAASLMVLVAAGCGAAPEGERTARLVPGSDPAAAESVVDIVVHRSATCGCCGGWQDHMADAGYDLEERHHADMAAVKERFGVPEDQASCHTTEVEGYFVEGHVPAAAVADLLESRPDIDGIALPGMPPGSPGMPGDQEAPFVVMALVDGEVVGEFGSYQM
jgi:hypothetical protein